MATLLSKIKSDARPASLKLLEFIKSQTMQVPGYGMAPLAEVNKIIKADPTLIELVPNIAADANGNVAVKATAIGLGQVAAPVAVAAVKTAFVIESGIEAPPIERGFGAGGGRTETYPFSQLEIGKSFFVPATEANPDPWKSLAGAVSSANRKYAFKTGATKLGRPGKDGSPATQIPVWQNTRVFTIRHMLLDPSQPVGVTLTSGPHSGKVNVDGARIFRFADAAVAPVAPTA